MQLPQAEQPLWVARLLGRPGMGGSFAWGLAEGTLFFVVPDVLISLAALFSPRRASLHMVAAILGAVLAGAFLFQWARSSEATARTWIAGVPFVSAEMFEQVDRDYRALGAAAVFKGPVYGIPYKIYAVEAPKHISLSALLLITIPARLERLLLAWLFFSAAGLGLRRWRPGRPALLVGAHAVFWAAFYAYYWSVI